MSSSANINTTQEQSNTPNPIEQNDSTNGQESTIQSDDSRIRNTLQSTFPSTKRVVLLIFGSGFITIGIICAIVIPFWLLSTKDSTSNGVNPDENNNTQRVAGRIYRNISDEIFQYRIEEFNTGIMDGYSNENELKDDIWNAAMSYIHKQYNSSIRFAKRPTELLSNRRRLYTQEDLVNEGDTIVYDTNYAYCEDGKYLYIWNLKTGVTIKIIDMSQKLQGGNGMTEPRIKSLLLVNGRLIVALELAVTSTGTTIIVNFGSLNVRIYDTNTLVDLSLSSADTALIASKNFTGLFISMHVVNSVLYIISKSKIDWDVRLNLPSLGQNETIDKYNNRTWNRVRQISYTFTTSLLQELRQLALTTKLLRINSWETNHSIDTNMHSPINSLLHFLTIIYSIDMSAGMTESELVQTQVGFFGDEYIAVRTSYDMIVLTMRVMDLNVKDNSTYPSEVIVTYDLVEKSPKPRSVGRLSRSTIESFTIFDDTIHVTTKFAELSNETTTTGTRSPLNTDNSVVTFVTVVIIKIPSLTSSSSSSSNDPIQMIEQSRVQLGVISSDSILDIRFLRNVTIVGTFSFDDNMGRLYVVDMSNPNNLTIMTVLDNNRDIYTISSLDSNSPRVIEIGLQQQSTVDTYTESVYFSIYDVTNTSQMIDRSQTLVDAAPYDSVKVDGNYDINKLYTDGYVFLPVSLTSNSDTYRSTDATMMFSIDKESGGVIEKNECRIINQMDTIESDCIDVGNLYSRSIVFGDLVMTMRGNQVTMTNLTSCQVLWNLPLAVRYKCDP